MRITIVALVVFMVCSICPANVNDVNSMTLEQCRARILELERIVKSQRNQIAKLVAELTEKPAETQIAEEKTNSAGEFRYSDGMVYRGKKQSPHFFNYWYDEFKDKIVYYNGQYLKASPQKYECEVVQVIDDNDAIVLISGYNVIESSENSGLLKEHITKLENKRCHLKGYNKTFTDYQPFSFNGCLISNVVECRTLNKEQFADAVNKGFDLTK
jgi:hypothetical protein